VEFVIDRHMIVGGTESVWNKYKIVSF